MLASVGTRGASGLTMHAVGAHRQQDVRARLAPDPVARSDRPGGQRGEQQVVRLRTHKHVRPGPQAEGAGQQGRVHEVVPLAALEPVAAGADRRQVAVLRPLQEEARRRHAVLHRLPALPRGARHVVGEGRAGLEAAGHLGRVRVDLAKPVLLVADHAAARQVRRPVVPPARVGRRDAGDLVGLVVRAGRVNPARVDDQGQPELLLERGQPLREQGGRGRIVQRPAVGVPGAFRAGARSWGLPACPPGTCASSDTTSYRAGGSGWGCAPAGNAAGAPAASRRTPCPWS